MRGAVVFVVLSLSGLPERPPAAAAWPLLRLSDPAAASAARAALDGARRWATRPRCSAILDEFADPQGRPLADRLTSLGVDFPRYLETIAFTDGSWRRPCRAAIVAFTTPGDHLVWMCEQDLKRDWREHPDETIAAFLHEALHTLGLGENPPTPREITKRVLARCRD